MSERGGKALTGSSIDALAPSFSEVPTSHTYVIHTAVSTSSLRTWAEGFGFQSCRAAVRRVRPAKSQELDGVLRSMQAVLDSMPVHETEPGAMDDLLQEIDELAPGRRAATSMLLGDAE